MMFARSMNSSTKAFVSFRAYICTSVGFWLSLSSTNRTLKDRKDKKGDVAHQNGRLTLLFHGQS